MAKTKSSEKSEQRERIEALKQEAARIANGEIRHWSSGDLDDDLAERFWRSIVECETAPETTNFRQLEEAGVQLPPPEALNDTQLTTKLWVVIEALARLRVFLLDTDHLSDRELYSLLWHDVLREPTIVMPPWDGAAEHVPFAGLGSAEDSRIYLRWYADEKERQRWLDDHPGYDMPPMEDPPYDRDSRMPQPFASRDVQ